MLFMLVIAAAVGVVWGSVLLKKTGLLGGCLAVMLVGSCFGYAYFHADVGGFSVTADRVLLALLAVTFVVMGRLGLTERRQLDKLDITLLLFMGVLVISTLSHSWKPSVLASLLVFNLMAGAIYWLARGAVFSERAVLGMFAAIAGFGLYLAVISILEQQQLLAFVYPRYIATSTFTEFLGRGRGPLLNPASNGLFLGSGWFCMLMFWPRVNHKGKLLLVVLSLIYGGGVICTMTRCVWAAVLLGLLILIVTNLPRRWATLFAAAVVLVGCIGIAAKWNDLQAFKRDKDVSVADMSKSAGLRPIFAVIAWHMFLDRPILGCGYGQYPVESKYYLSDRSTQLRLEKARIYVQHNVVLSLLTETGLVGSGLFVLLMLLWFQTGWYTWTCRQAPLIYRQQGLIMVTVLSVYLVIGMFQDLTIAWMANQLIFFMAGVSRGLRDHCFPIVASKQYAADSRLVAT
jgi:hypothetical protein